MTFQIMQNREGQYIVISHRAERTGYYGFGKNLLNPVNKIGMFFIAAMYFKIPYACTKIAAFDRRLKAKIHNLPL